MSQAMINPIRVDKASDHPLLVVIPGFDGTIGSVKPVVTRLSASRQVLVIDYSAETNATLEGLSAEIASVITTKGHAVIDLMGQSIGTIIAAQLASGYGLPVRRVVLMSTFTCLRRTILSLTVISKVYDQTDRNERRSLAFPTRLMHVNNLIR
jgi:pimeloyl-ACP methyl ester carboxylesterase